MREFLIALALFAQISIPRIPNIPGIPSLPGGVPLPQTVPIPPLVKAPPDSIVVQPAQRLAQVPALDGFSPARFLSLTDLPRDAAGVYTLSPGAFELTNESFCLRAGNHGPTAASAYYVSALSGSRASYVHDVLAQWHSHPDIPQSTVQSLLWAITAQAKIKALPPALQTAAHTLLTPTQIDQLDGGALGNAMDFLSKAGVGLPAPIQQMLTTESNLRDLLTRGNSSYQEIAALAVPRTSTTQDSGRQRWSYDPQGFFIRYLPASYASTTIQIYAPPVYSVTHDAQGRITSLVDANGTRLDISYAAAVQMTLSIAAHFPGSPTPVQHVVLGSTAIAPSKIASTDRDVVATDAIAHSAEQLVASAKAPNLDKAGATNFLRGAVPGLICKSNGGCTASRVASVTLVALGAANPTYDPNSAMAAPVDGGNQPLAQTGTPTPPFRDVDCDRVRSQLDFAINYQKKYSDPDTVDAAKHSNWSGQDFEDAVAQKAWAGSAFGSGSGSAESSFYEGGETNMETCDDTYPSLSKVIDMGLPAIMYTVIMQHEERHVMDCRQRKAHNAKDTWEWRQATEIAAYQVSINILRQWIAANCAGGSNN